MAVLIKSGDLRHQIQIQQRATAQDATGQPVSSGWTTIRTTFAKIATIGSRDDYQVGQFSAQVTHTITIRYTPNPEITPGMQVVFGGHTYIIQAIDNSELRGIRVNLMCLEINGGQ
jgi:SPP1 family predicted phage head-tail adaptor